MVLAVIPARFASSRLPGKALADIGGVPMIVRVWERVRAVPAVDTVLVATDDARIAEVARDAGAEVAMTGPCATGTDRVAEAARLHAPGLRETDVVVNVQGDEPFVDPADIGAVAAAVGDCPIATASAPLLGDPTDPARVKVVTDHTGRALYFSRLPVPSGGPWRVHVGVYAFAAWALAEVAALPPSPLERAESLEQLRWLQAGYAIRVVPVAVAHFSIDTPADLERARRACPKHSSGVRA